MNPQIRSIAGLMMLAFALAASADQDRVVTPPDSALRVLAVPGADDDPYVRFAGQQAISGRFRFENDADSPYWTNPFMLFFPDEGSLQRLPYLTERGAPEKPLRILISNPEEAAATLLGDEIMRDLLSGKRPKLEGVATIVIDEFRAGFECDEPSYVARFVKVDEILSRAGDATNGLSGCQ